MCTDNGNKLNQAELTDYQQHGYLVRHSVFSAAEISLLRDAIETATQAAVAQAASGTTYYLDGKRFVDLPQCTIQFEHQPESTTARVIEPVHLLHPLLDRLVDDPRLVSPMRQIIGQPHLALWTAKLNLKRPRQGSGFGWHQDSPYWMHDSQHVDLLPNVMLALDDQTVDNGCFEVIAGSHHQGMLPGSNNGTQLGGFFTDPQSFDEQARVALTGPAGSLFFFSPHSVHGSQPNHSALPRRALILTYQPGDHRLLKVDQVRNIAVG